MNNYFQHDERLAIKPMKYLTMSLKLSKRLFILIYTIMYANGIYTLFST